MTKENTWSPTSDSHTDICTLTNTNTHTQTHRTLISFDAPTQSWRSCPKFLEETKRTSRGKLQVTQDSCTRVHFVLVWVAALVCSFTENCGSLLDERFSQKKKSQPLHCKKCRNKHPQSSNWFKDTMGLLGGRRLDSCLLMFAKHKS